MRDIEAFLKERKEKGIFRILRPACFRQEEKINFGNKEFIDFSSNDYLGLSGHPKIKDRSRQAIEKLGAGSSASRLLSGDLQICHQLEEEIASFKGKEKALIFNSGYQANLGIISTMCSKGDVVFSDKLNHASIVDGIKLAGVTVFRFLHNDLNHLEILLKKERGKYKNCLIITETIFSMDGDRSPLKGIVELKEKFDCQVMVDEAHATGIFGKNGSGIVEEDDLADRIDLIMGTFGKALGSFGAYLASSKKIIDYMINTSRSFIYSTALPPAIIAANLASLELVKEEPYRRKELLENADYFRGELIKRGFNVKGSSQIVPIIVGDNDKTVKLSMKLQDSGYWVLPIRPPTVPQGEARLRFSLSYYHNRETLRNLAKKISEISYV